MIKDLTSANVYVLFKYYTRKYSSVCTFASIENEGDWREEETKGRRRLRWGGYRQVLGSQGRKIIQKV